MAQIPPSGSGSWLPSYLDGVPEIISLSPTGSTAGGNLVTITGTDLDAATSVTFDGLEAGVSSNTPTEIVVTAPGHDAGTVDVVVQQRRRE